MIGLVVAAHGRLAQELVDTGASIVGPMPQVVAFSVSPSGSAEELREKLLACIAQVDTGDGVLVLADLFGGSPCTISVALCQRPNFEVVTGFNLPMLIKASTLRNEGFSVESLAQALVSYGQRSITQASQVMRDALRAAAH
jgi:PTS system mannose-specific IIA component